MSSKKKKIFKCLKCNYILRSDCSVCPNCNEVLVVNKDYKKTIRLKIINNVGKNNAKVELNDFVNYELNDKGLKIIKSNKNILVLRLIKEGEYIENNDYIFNQDGNLYSIIVNIN